MFENDVETGAIRGMNLWNYLFPLISEQAAFVVVSPTTGHPNAVHEELGGGFVPDFRRALVADLQSRAQRGEVFRISANAFAFRPTALLPSSWIFRFQGIDVHLSTCELRASPLGERFTGESVGAGHFRLMEALARQLSDLPAELNEHQYTPASFGSWNVRIRYRGKEFRLLFDGRDEDLLLQAANGKEGAWLDISITRTRSNGIDRSLLKVLEDLRAAV